MGHYGGALSLIAALCMVTGGGTMMENYGGHSDTVTFGGTIEENY